ncbi:putative potassium transporter 13 [Acorus calamus]|uniref:Potassium transporter 13 n=1 Tax=Acorus calamus TaxID=4465 RepID=A0AAV9FR24_ACOCL|nr:putative potassium transporter 13 [Acorus calamus]
MVKEFFEKHRSSRIILFLVVLLGTSMVIGDGVLTPTMSVLSAVSGVKIKAPNLHDNYTVFIACIIIMGLFALQHYGTHRVTGKDGWSSLGGIVLCITGAEAMFADLGHFSKLSLRMAFTGVVYPCLILAYMGEAAYLSKNKADLRRSFYKAIPEFVFWPVFIIATLATVVGSQAIISATFSIISQCRSMKCFPRVKIIHKSSKIHGQIYIPEVNWSLMVLCLVVTIGFKDTEHIGNAYVITTIWKRTIFAALSFVTIFGSLELLYLSSCLVKIHKGGWLPLLISFIVLCMMCAWHYGTSKRHDFELQNKVCLDQLLSFTPTLGIVRVPGIGLVCSNIATGVPPMFVHFITNFPAIHRILIFVSLQSLMVPKVPPNEQFLIGRIGPPDYRFFQCVVRYGYKDDRDSYEFENKLIMRVAEFLQQEQDDGGGGQTMSLIEKPSGPIVSALAASVGKNRINRKKRVRFQGTHVSDEVRELVEARESGVAYMMGHTCVMACKSSPFLKKFAIDVVYDFLRRNCRRPAVALGFPHAALIEVGMAYHV